MATIEIRDVLDDETGQTIFPRTHVKAVIGLADSTFFEEYTDGNNIKYVRLRARYAGLFADGCVSAGGVGTDGGGGGGGLINSVKGVADLNTPIATEVLTETFSSKAIQTIWDAVKVLQNTTPNVSLVNGANNSTLTVNGTSADFYTKSQIDAIVGAVYRPAGNASTVSELGSLTAANIGKVYNMTASFTTTADFLEGAGKTFPAGTNVVIVQSGTNTYKYDVLSGFVDLSGYAQKVSGATNGHFAGLDSNGNLTDSGHSHADYVTALGTSGNYLTWTKNGTTNNITVPFATNATTATKVGSSNVGHSHRPIYLSSGTPTQVTDVATDFIGWPYANHGSLSSLENLFYAVGPNVFAYPKVSYIDVEYTNNGGTTWTDYGCSDADKTNLFTRSCGNITLGKKGSTGVTTNDATRITMHLGAGMYFKCEFLAFRHYFPGTCDVKIEYTTYAATTTWVEHTTLSGVTSNPGYRVVPFAKFVFGNNGVHDLRITFSYNGTTYANYSYYISEIRAYGSNVYSTTCQYAKTGHIYNIDESQNAIFPADVLPTSNNAQNIGSSSKRWSNVYATALNLNGALSGATTGSFSSAVSAGSLTVGGVSVTPSNYVTLDGTQTITGAKTFSQAITLSGSTDATRRIYFGDSTHYLELDQYGFHFSHGVYSDDFVSAGGIGTGGGGGGGELNDLADVEINTSTLASGDLLTYNGTKWVNIDRNSLVSLTAGTGKYTLSVGETSIDVYTKGQVDALVEAIDLSAYALKTGADTYDFLVNSLKFKNTGHNDSYISADSGPGPVYYQHQRLKWTYSRTSGSISDPEVTESKYVAFLDDIPSSLKNPYKLTFGSKEYDGSVAVSLTASDIGALTSHQTVSLTGGTNNGTLKLTVGGTATDNIAVTGLGSLAYKSSLVANDIPDISGTYVTIATVQTVSGVKTFTGGIVMSGADIVLGSTDHLDIGPVRLLYDSTAGCLRVTTNQTGNNAPIIGLYADGQVTAGGVGSSGGGGGYGVESITTAQDGTITFHFTGGDTTTVDLNHEHPQYNSKLAESSQPSGGFLPDVVYELGTLTGSVTFALASAVSGQVNHYFWTFTAGSTAPTITWPSGITWVDSAPTITAGNKYQISILDGVAAYMEA